MAGTLQDDHERVPPESARSQFAKDHGRTDGTVFLRRRRETAGRLRGAESQRLVTGFVDPPRYRMLDGQARRDPKHEFFMRSADGLLHFLGRFSPREKKSKIAGAFWPSRDVIKQAGGDQQFRNSRRRTGCFFPNTPFQNPASRDGNHHYAGGQWLARRIATCKFKL